MSAISCTRSNGVSSYGPSHVSVSRMYSTCVSECFVPLMNVTPETIGHSPCSRTTSSAPIPLSTVIDRRFGKRALERPRGRSQPGRLRRDDRDVERRELRRVVGRAHARLRRSCPLTRSPSRFSASACSRRRVSTDTSHTQARCPAKRLPITPAPTMQTLSITPEDHRRAVTCQSTVRATRASGSRAAGTRRP